MKHLLVTLIAIFLLSPAYARDMGNYTNSFDAWLTDFKRDALAQGISQETLDDAFASTEPIDRVIELDGKQPESTMTLDRYMTNVVTPKRIKQGRELMAEHRTLLRKIGKEYGVQPRFIVALWGVETNFGSNTGGFQTIDALATLAYEGRRAQFFRDELIKALKILESEHMSASEMQGSWAGALGQCQFMPSSFLQYAVDYDKDGKRDIWNDDADVFASIANYLKSSGWNAEEGWGRPVKLPAGFDRTLADIKQSKPMHEWKKLGIRTENGHALPEKNLTTTLIFVGEGDDAVPYIIYGNYKVLLKWNRSRFFATAVGTLADAIGK